jgi:HSP20 family molecular chaperone IbpA
MSSDEFQKVTYKNSKVFKLEQEIKNLKKRIYSPKVDLIERNNFYLIKIELPGVIKDSIKIQIKEHQIILISGRKNQDNILESDNIIYRESKYEDFMRRIKLPSTIKYTTLNQGNLDFENGVLYITFEKSNKKQESQQQEYQQQESQQQESQQQESQQQESQQQESQQQESQNWADME